VIDASTEQQEIVQLVQRCLAEEEAGWLGFVERFQQPVFGLCLRMLRHRQDAEDVAQEVFLAVWTKAGGFAPEKGTATAWVFAIARNRALDRRRQLRWLVGLDGLGREPEHLQRPLMRAFALHDHRKMKKRRRVRAGRHFRSTTT